MVLLLTLGAVLLTAVEATLDERTQIVSLPDCASSVAGAARRSIRRSRIVQGLFTFSAGIAGTTPPIVLEKIGIAAIASQLQLATFLSGIAAEAGVTLRYYLIHQQPAQLSSDADS